MNNLFSENLLKLYEKSLNNKISKEDEKELLYALMQEEDFIFLAGNIRKEFFKDEIFTCSILNAKSGHCSQDCAFCAQSKYHNVKIDTYPLLQNKQIIDKALSFAKHGANYFSIVTSGLSLNAKEIDNLCRCVEKIKKKTKLSVCVSLGLLTKQKAVQLKNAGVTTYHHNLETAESFFKEICTTHSYEEDITSILIAKEAGLEICSAGIIGLGESWLQRIELALTLKKLKVNRMPINFLNPIKQTKMEKKKLILPMEALKTIALFRFVNPETDLTVCGGREKTLTDYQSWIFKAGANGIMIGNYLTTKGRTIRKDLKMISNANLKIRN